MVEVGCNVETSRPTLLLRPQEVDTQNIPVDLTFSWCSCSWAFDLVGQEKYEVVVEHWKQAVVAARDGELFLRINGGRGSHQYIARASCRLIKLGGFISSDYVGEKTNNFAY